MTASDYWRLFLETGAPEAYLLYSMALKMEEYHVPDRSGNRLTGNQLQ